MLGCLNILALASLEGLAHVVIMELNSIHTGVALGVTFFGSVVGACGLFALVSHLALHFLYRGRDALRRYFARNHGMVGKLWDVTLEEKGFYLAVWESERGLDSWLLEDTSKVNPKQIANQKQMLLNVRKTGVIWPSLSMKYKEGKVTPYIFMVDHMHRYLSLCIFASLVLTSFYFLSTSLSVVYAVCIGALFVFQQEGVRMYHRFPRVYHFIDMVFQGGTLVVIFLHPESLLCSCWPSQRAVMFLAGFELLVSLDGILWGRGGFKKRIKGFSSKEGGGLLML